MCSSWSPSTTCLTVSTTKFWRSWNWMRTRRALSFWNTRTKSRPIWSWHAFNQNRTFYTRFARRKLNSSPCFDIPFYFFHLNRKGTWTYPSIPSHSFAFLPFELSLSWKWLIPFGSFWTVPRFLVSERAEGRESQIPRSPRDALRWLRQREAAVVLAKQRSLSDPGSVANVPAARIHSRNGISFR